MRCFGCGGEGHLERDCPMTAYDDGPPWCGTCHQRTRLAELASGQLQRCPNCHPLRHQHLKHLKRCPGCRKLVYEYDEAPCGHHATPAAPPKPPIEHIRQITRRTT